MLEQLKNLPWGAHFCQFVHTAQDLLDILVPYFKKGLEENEYCMWVLAQPLSAEQAGRAMREAVPEFERYMAGGQMEITTHDRWYVEDGAFDPDRVIKGWAAKLESALARGFSGLRFTGDAFWLQKKDWESFAEYERAVDGIITRSRIKAICTYHLAKCNIEELLEMMATHRGALIRRNGKWEVIGSIERAETALHASEDLTRSYEELRREMAERKGAQEALQRASAYNRSLIETSLDPFVTIGEDGRITDVNAATEAATGLAREELISTDFSDYFTEPGMARAGYQTAFREGIVRDHPLEIRHKGGSITPVLYNASVYRDEKGNILGVFAAARDITKIRKAEVEILKLNLELEQKVIERTAELKEANENLKNEIEERKRAEEEIRKLDEELKQHVRNLEAANAELEAFSYSVSHDLRAPLRAIDGFSRIMLEDYSAKLDAEAGRLLNVIRTNTQKMGHLIDDLLSFSRIGRQKIKRGGVDMQALALGVIEDVKLSAPERKINPRKINFKLGELPPARGDGAMLRQVLLNLISNAAKFTRGRAEANIEVCGNREGKEVVYCVSDNGVGFDMRYAGKLFGMFQRLHPAGDFEGTGVGLAIVQRIVHRHGGRVWAEGKVNEGARFYFTLPPFQKENSGRAIKERRYI